MAYSIRSQVFETNSSSCHSIAFSSKEENELHDPMRCFTVRDGAVIISNDVDLTFSWGIDILTTPFEKFCYAVAALIPSYMDDIEREVFRRNWAEDPRKASRELYKEDKQKLLRAVGFPESVNDIHLPVYVDTYDDTIEVDTGVIDHQSYGMLENYLNSNPNKTPEEALKELILDDSYIIIISNDNRGYDDDEENDYVPGFQIIYG